jgi:hypothetical protein
MTDEDERLISNLIIIAAWGEQRVVSPKFHFFGIHFMILLN